LQITILWVAACGDGVEIAYPCLADFQRHPRDSVLVVRAVVGFIDPDEA
jgi:hypothetical protein